MKLAFAKDIDFVKKSGASKSPHYYQERVLENLEEGIIFNGFILPWKGVLTKCSLTLKDSGVTLVNATIHKILTSKVSGRAYKNTPETLEREARELLKGTGQVFHGWKFFNPKDTKTSIMIVKCERCGSLEERMIECLRVSKRKGSIIQTSCEECKRAFLDNGLYEKYKHLPHYLYILNIGDDYIKVGCTFRDVEKRVREIQSTCKHKVTVFKSFKFSTGYEAYAVEEAILNDYIFDSHAVDVDDMANGYSETFPRSHLRRISRKVNHLIKKPLTLWETFTPSYIDRMVEGEVTIPEAYKADIEEIRKSIDEYGVDLTPVL